MALPLKSPAAVAIGALVIALGAGASLWWLLGDNKAVLFDQLDGQRLNAVAAELDRAGIGYHIDRETSAINVAEADAARARLAVMGSSNLLQDAAGFELFDKSEFGMTEFAQKINYQRAIEGEIARTVSALADVKHTRVHLVLPEHGLLRANERKPRASVTVFLNDGASLSADHIRGIQRITASAVPELDEAEVTVVDQHGAILSEAGGGAAAPTSSARLLQKKAVESYLRDKIHRVLAPAIGDERFAVSVDVALDLNQRTTTTEKVLGSGANAGVRRLKESTNRDKGEGGADDMQREVEYAVGHQSEQIVHGAGEITRLQVGVVVDARVDGVDLESLRELIAATAGFDRRRGDKITVVQSALPAAASAAEKITAADGNVAAGVENGAAGAGKNVALAIAPPAAVGFGRIAALFAAGLAVGGLGAALVLRPRHRRLDEPALQQLRQRLEAWVDSETLEARRP